MENQGAGMAEGRAEHRGAVGHVVPVGVYFSVFTALMILTGVTAAVAFLDLGFFNTIVALGIAFTKATLVGLYFMHLRWAEKLNGLGVLAAVAFLFLLVFITLGDYMSRGWLGGMGG